MECLPAMEIARAARVDRSELPEDWEACRGVRAFQKSPEDFDSVPMIHSRTPHVLLARSAGAPERGVWHLILLEPSDKRVQMGQAIKGSCVCIFDSVATQVCDIFWSFLLLWLSALPIKDMAGLQHETASSRDSAAADSCHGLSLPTRAQMFVSSSQCLRPRVRVCVCPTLFQRV